MSAPAAVTVSVTSLELENKLWDSVRALGTRDAINQRIEAVVRSIMELLQADAKEIDLDKYERELVQLKLLYKHRHAIESLPDHVSCLCDKCSKQAASLHNRILQIRFQMQLEPADRNSPAYRVHAIGIANHLQTLKRKIAQFVTSSRAFVSDLKNTNALKNLDALRKKLMPLSIIVGQPPPKNAEALRKELIQAAQSADWELLEKLIDSHSVSIYHLFAAYNDPSERCGLFEVTLFHYSTLPELQERHFRTLDVLVNAGSDIREGRVSPDMTLYNALIHNLLDLLQDESKLNEKSVIQLIRYLHRKGFQLWEPNADYNQRCLASDCLASGHRLTSLNIAEEFLALGLRMPTSFSTVECVKEHFGPIETRFLIQEGAADQADRKTFMAEVRRMAPDDVEVISETLRVRDELLTIRTTATVANISGALLGLNWSNGGAEARILPPLADVITRYAYIPDDEVPVYIWREVEATMQSRKKAADAAATAAPAKQ